MKILKTWKRFMAVFMMAVLLTGLPVSADAKEWVDGNTPDELSNRVKTSRGAELSPSARTDFHVWHFAGVIPTSPRAFIDRETGVSTSFYDDAYTLFYMCDNGQYGPLAEESLYYALKNAGAEKGDAITINLLKYEGQAFKSIDYTEHDIEFRLAIPDNLVNKDRDFAMLRLNLDGTVSYLTDLDTDSKTLTFQTNYFEGQNVYCLAYGGKGCFDAYKPAEEAAVQ